jgi:hypothetical protein
VRPVTPSASAVSIGRALAEKGPGCLLARVSVESRLGVVLGRIRQRGAKALKGAGRLSSRERFLDRRHPQCKLLQLSRRPPLSDDRRRRRRHARATRHGAGVSVVASPRGSARGVVPVVASTWPSKFDAPMLTLVVLGALVLSGLTVRHTLQSLLQMIATVFAGV